MRTKILRSLLAVVPLAATVLVAADPSVPAADSAATAAAQRLLAEQAMERENSNEAVAAAQKAAALAPDNAACQYTLGVAYGIAAQHAVVIRQFGLARKCVAAFQRAVALAPANVTYHQSLFDYYRQAPAVVGGGMEKAWAEVALIRNLDARQGALDAVRLDVADKKFAEAQTELDAVLKTAPDDLTALYQTGRVAAISGQGLDRGRSALRRCLVLKSPGDQSDPSLASINLRLGNVLRLQGDKAGARAAYQAALAADPTFSAAEDALKNL